MDVQPAPAPGSDIVVSGNPGPEITEQTTPTAASVPAPPVAAAQSGELPHETPGIAGAIAKLYAPGGIEQPGDLNVSYRVLRDHEIVTVFTDPKTGKEVTQVPSEALIGLAEFFDQQQGVTFDRSA